MLVAEVAKLALFPVELAVRAEAEPVEKAVPVGLATRAETVERLT